ncbi:carbon-nitrogen hydrolase family protein [Hydrogenophaga sp. 2FB]|uniref:carbon-nitrogen hydrolase family protein n=1 Tax=Hydrogenophaga sp. 2FB TaxID=2502187 RepID=UPI0014858E11|nr:carbon-nitrogen hydrolase family protein [Hydrogenophaga sp. 2FB]
MTVALAQLQPSADVAQNLRLIEELAVGASDQGVEWLLLPEYATCLDGRRASMEVAADLADTIHEFISATARRLGIWILLGSYVLRSNSGKMVNRSVLFDSAGKEIAYYDKLHMFDVVLPDGRQIRESSAYEGGDRAVVVETPWGLVGMSICFDLRFPQLFRTMAQAGAEVIVVPSAFAIATGELHWSALLRARSIENSAFILAPATCGESPGNRPTFGHSMIVDPSGRIVASLDDQPGLLVHKLPMGEVAQQRIKMPTLKADRAFELCRLPTR